MRSKRSDLFILLQVERRKEQVRISLCIKVDVMMILCEKRKSLIENGNDAESFELYVLRLF